MYRVIKRILDFILSVIFLPFIIIAIIIFGVLIKIEDRGPIFYFADRIGKNGEIFKMFKFRSMVQDAPDLRMEDGSTFNSENDSRVTKLGKFMRKTSIDEVPQILNVLIGDMSFIGPRPDSAMWIDNYTEEERIIHKVAPGISGYNQVINRNAVSTKEKLKNDIYYVNNMNFWLDLKIVFLTIKTILFSENIYREEDDTIV
ncbi:sugar transferase [Carnobacterium maltaromaticum]|uniref:sugar transferase n=1 Tax=Carnobacterium maltaromaticum TaxID=2751 RepID=UPI00165C2BB7|nr:sugar transferase [Carnobacterium maltaromaticum]MBC9810685.1 sugar transferase [Carnobacterium maltaromaticum]